MWRRALVCGLQFTIDPAMGFKPVIFAFVVEFLAGTRKPPIRVLCIEVHPGPRTGLPIPRMPRSCSKAISSR